jgi:hypothetical protein
MYPRPQLESAFVDGRLVSIEFLGHLSDIALPLNDYAGPQASLPYDELDKITEELDGKLCKLASIAPPGWWVHQQNPSLPDSLLQYFYHHVKIRVHLPLFLRPTLSEQSVRSWTACIDACRVLSRLYLLLTPLLPGAFFMTRIANLQIFTALIVLILAEHSSLSSQQTTNIHSKQDEGASEGLVQEVLDLIESQIKQTGRTAVLDALVTIKALIALLENQAPSGSEGVTVRVPLLGKLHVRPRHIQSSATIPQAYNLDGPSTGGNGPVGKDILGAEILPDFSNQGWEPVFWSIEEDTWPWSYGADAMEEDNQLQYM